MAKFLYRFEHAKTGLDRYILDLDSQELASASMKYAARHLAARHIESGSLDLSEHVLVEDGNGRLLDRRPLGDFVRVA